MPVKFNLIRLAPNELHSLPSLNDFLMGNLYKKLTADFENNLKQYLIKNLNDIGIVFNSENDFIEFVKARVHRIGFEEIPNYYELYLDFVDEKNRGTFLGSYSDKIDVSFEGNKATATIGRIVNKWE